jgi:hypothetical protein
MKALRILGLGIALALQLAPAAGAEVQRPHEVVTLGFPAGDGFLVYATLHPQKRVAVLGAQAGVEDPSSGIWSSTSYVERVARRSIGDVVHVDFGSLGRIDGRFVADGSPRVGHLSRLCRGHRPVSESGHFTGRLVFRGDGGYLYASTRRAPIAFVRRTFRLQCKKGHAADFDNPRPGLFGFVQASTDYLSNSDGTYLRSTVRGDDLVTEFMALDHFRADTVGFKAVAREWLGDVATTRSVEVESAPEAAFVLGEPKQRPETAFVQPPLPFRGAAEYTPAAGTFTGDLAISFLGKDLALAGPSTKVEVCPRPRQDKLWDCP